MSDIRKFAVAPTSRLHFRSADDELMYAEGPEGNPDLSKPIAANLYGPGSKQFARAQAQKQNRLIDKLKKKGKTDESAEEKREEDAEFLAACTESFENVEYDGLTGKALFKAVYTDIEIGFMAEQAGKHIQDWANFSKPSTTTLPSTSAKGPG